MTITLDVTRDKLSEPFYAPSFRVQIGPPTKEPSAFETVFDVTRVTYKDGLSQLDSFEFTLNNFNWGSTDVRYAERLTDGGPATSPMSILPGCWARLWLGYQTAMNLFPMLTGRVTSVTPNFGGDGGTTMTVRVLSSLEAMREQAKKYVWKSEQKNGLIKDPEIVRRICARYQPPVTPVIPRGIDPLESGESTVTQANQTDIAFLIDRAKKRGYIVCFREALPAGAVTTDAIRKKEAGEPQKFLYFGPSNMLQQQELVQMGDRPEQYELRWGATLMDFKPTLNVSSNLWSKVSVDFHNRRTMKRPNISLTLDQLWASEPGLNQDLEPLLRALIDGKVLPEHPLTNIPVRTEAEAKDLVRNTLRDNFLQLVTAEGSTVGHPELRACSRVQVKGIGVLSGTFFITGTTHTFDDSGYRTQFSARREQTAG
jgi:hypothetical protein